MTSTLGVPVIDTLIGFPECNSPGSPVEYLFPDRPLRQFPPDGDPVAWTLAEMDRWGVEQALIDVGASDDDMAGRAHRQYPDRFIAAARGDPNEGMKGIRRIRRLREEHDIRAVTVFPAGTQPQIPINGNLMYPIYATCVDLDIPVFCCAGVPGPPVQMAPQRVELIDEVMHHFPDLTFVTRHGCEPWEDLAVKLMLKWPNLYYSTSAFAPRHYPRAIVDYANTRGADKVIYAGYFPMGLSLERIMTELPSVGFKDEVWPKFLRENAARVLRLDR